MEIKITTSSASKDELKAIKVYKQMVYKSSLSYSYIIGVLGLFFLGIGLVSLINDSSESNNSLPILFIGLSLIATVFFNYLFMRRVIGASLKLRHEYLSILDKDSQNAEYLIDEKGISFSSHLQQFQITWNLISSFKESKDFIFLFLKNPQGNLNFSTESLSEAEKKDLDYLLLSKVRKI